MTQNEIIRMAREAGFTDVWIKPLERFAALVAAHSVANYKMLQEIEYVGKLYPDGLTNQIEAAVLAEREACAKVCEENAKEWADGNNDWCRGQVTGSNECAAAIRARGEK